MKRLPTKARMSRVGSLSCSEPRLYCTGFVNPVILSKTTRPQIRVHSCPFVVPADSAAAAAQRLVPERALAGEDHGDAGIVATVDDVPVAQGSAGLDNR